MSKVAIKKAECLPVPEVVECRGTWVRLTDAWNRFWFEPTDPTTLGVIRICTGLVLLYAYLSIAPRLLSLIGPNAWIDSKAVAELRAAGQSDVTLYERITNGWWGQSIWFYVQDPVWIWVTYGLFLTAIICFTVGFYSRTANVLVWVGHLSFVVRSFAAWFGFDVVLGMVTLYLMVGPTGSALSVDARLRRRREELGSNGSISAKPLPSWNANTAIRLIQVHICIIYFCSGVSKLPGKTWQNGTAIWLAWMSFDEMPFDLRWVSHLSDWALSPILWSAVIFTLTFEVGFAFLIWFRRLRPWVLLGALMLHLGIGVLMGLDAFSAIMLTGCLSFVSPVTIRRIVEWSPMARSRVADARNVARPKSQKSKRPMKNKRRPTKSVRS